MKASVKNCIKLFRDLDSAGDPITSMALVEAFGIADTERSTSMDIGAGWISTMRRYGFLRAVKGSKVDGPSRQLQVYQLTDWGRRYKTKASPMAASELKIAANPGKKK